jgi:adenosylhomocysteinase
MDGSFGIQALCVEYLSKNGKGMKAGVHDVPESIDNSVAKIALESQGIQLEAPTEAQKTYSESWEEGT